jgi:hypothetical protein
VLLILAVLVPCRIVLAADDDDDGNPHHMMKADGEADNEKCEVCHTGEDLSLSTSKLETCTTCHDPTLHSGSYEHLQANAEAVKAHLPPAKEGQEEMPLAEDGKMYCGTCHLFHDPRVSEEKTAPVRPISFSPIAKAVREATSAKWPVLAQQHGAAEAGATFAEKSTPALRLPLDDNQLCGHCHGKGGK